MSDVNDMREVEVEVASEILEELRKGKAIGEFIAYQRYSQAQRDEFSRIIKEFNWLYYQLYQQTWLNTRWRGVPTQKAPTDMWIYQELIHAIQPDVIIETGSYAGGSALFLQDMLRLEKLHHSMVVSIDIDHTRVHETARKLPIRFLTASSVEPATVAEVKSLMLMFNLKKVMVVLDSAHTKEHVAKELELWAPLVSVGSALVIEDTNVDGVREAVEEWRGQHDEFQPEHMCEKFMLTFNRDGYYEKVRA